MSFSINPFASCQKPRTESSAPFPQSESPSLFQQFYAKVSNVFKTRIESQLRGKPSAIEVLNLSVVPNGERSSSPTISNPNAVASNVKNIQYNQDKKGLEKNLKKGFREVEKYVEAFNASNIGDQPLILPELDNVKLLVSDFIENGCQIKKPSVISGESVGSTSSLIMDGKNSFILLPAQIGQGGKKAIFIGIDLTSGEDVAISVMQEQEEDGTGSSSYEAYRLPDYLFAKLKNVAAKEGQGGVLPVKQLIECSHEGKKTQFLVQKLCRNTDLFTLLSGGHSLTNAQKRQYASDLINGYYQLHNAGILHRDAKPDNVFLHAGRAYIGDFDFTISTNRSDQTNKDKLNQIGTPAYAAPETLLDGTYDEKSEVWALGTILYALCAEAQASVVNAIGERIESNPELEWSTSELQMLTPWAQQTPNNAMEELLAQMICVNPHERLSMSGVKEAFAKIHENDFTFDHIEVNSSTL